MSDLQLALNGLRDLLDDMKLHDDTGDPRDEGYMDAWGRVDSWLRDREALVIEPEYEWSISFGEGEAIANRSTYPTAALARQYVARYGASHVERRVKAGPWERVEG